MSFYRSKSLYVYSTANIHALKCSLRHKGRVSGVKYPNLGRYYKFPFTQCDASQGVKTKETVQRIHRVRINRTFDSKSCPFNQSQDEPLQGFLFGITERQNKSHSTFGMLAKKKMENWRSITFYFNFFCRWR